ncbi:MAG: branched-chain amino acid ABC transporter permease [Proteobacteria bacterium]|nr:branched-chain amino acid ABC transporter permease [Pseudomonadota bacterium]
MKDKSSILTGFIFACAVFAAVIIFMAIDNMAFSLALILFYALASILLVKTGFWKKVRNSISDNPKKLCLLTACFVLATPLFFFNNPYVLHILTLACIYCVATIGLNIQVGSTGMVNFAQGAFFGIGAYVSALLGGHFGVSFWISLPAGMLAAGFFGLLMGLPTLKTREYHLSLVTIAFAYISFLLVMNFDWTGGPDGIADISKPVLFGFKIGQTVTVGGVTIPGVAFYCYMVLAFLGIALLVAHRLHNSWYGMAWNAIRDDEISSRCYGLSLRKSKLEAFVFGSLFAGAAGALYAHFIGFMSTENMSFQIGLLMVCMVILGGMDNIAGVLVGTLLLIVIPEKLRAFDDYRMLFYGLVLISMLLFRPQGIIPSKPRFFDLKKRV